MQWRGREWNLTREEQIEMNEKIFEWIWSKWNRVEWRKKKVKEVRGKNEGKQMLSVWIGFKWFSMKWNKNTKVGMKNKWMR